MHRLTETTAPDLIRGQSQLHEAPDQVRGCMVGEWRNAR